MAMFFFAPDQPVEVVTGTSNKADAIRSKNFPPLTYVYLTRADEWRIRDPKTGNWINYMAEGVPEIYRAQVLLLVAAYPD